MYLPYIAASMGLYGTRNCGSLLLKLSLETMSTNPILYALEHSSGSLERVGEGAFGSVYRVKIPSLGNKESIGRAISNDNDNHDVYVVKRIKSEQSIHDLQVFPDIFYEVLCLKHLQDSGCQGVCSVYDIGTTGSHYYMVLENGWKDISAWRNNWNENEKIIFNDKNNENNIIDGIIKNENSSYSLYILLLIIIDICKIVEDIHLAGVIHFDIKCANFILRDDPCTLLNIQKLHKAARDGKASGLVFATDFGESMLSDILHVHDNNRHHEQVKDTKCRSMVQRSRGTLCIQSPEMLSVNSELNTSGQERKFNASARNSPLHFFENPDEQSDVWSLGLLVIELFTGKLLLGDKPWAELCVMLCSKSDISTSGLNMLPLEQFWDKVEKLEAVSTWTDEQGSIHKKLTSFLESALKTHAHHRGNIKDLRGFLINGLFFKEIEEDVKDKRYMTSVDDEITMTMNMDMNLPYFFSSSIPSTDQNVSVPCTCVCLGTAVYISLGIEMRSKSIWPTRSPAQTKNLESRDDNIHNSSSHGNETGKYGMEYCDVISQSKGLGLGLGLGLGGKVDYSDKNSLEEAGISCILSTLSQKTYEDTLNPRKTNTTVILTVSQWLNSPSILHEKGIIECPLQPLLSPNLLQDKSIVAVLKAVRLERKLGKNLVVLVPASTGSMTHVSSKFEHSKAHLMAAVVLTCLCARSENPRDLFSCLEFNAPWLKALIM
jgi:serine/threonine protein kinase